MKTFTIKLYRYNELKTKGAKQRAANSYFASDQSVVYDEAREILKKIAASELRERKITPIDIDIFENIDGVFDNVDSTFINIYGFYKYKGIRIHTNVEVARGMEGETNVSGNVIPRLDENRETTDKDRVILADFEIKLKAVIKYLSTRTDEAEQQAWKEIDAKLSNSDEFFTVKGRHVSEDEIKKLEGY